MRPTAMLRDQFLECSYLQQNGQAVTNCGAQAAKVGQALALAIYRSAVLLLPRPETRPARWIFDDYGFATQSTW